MLSSLPVNLFLIGEWFGQASLINFLLIDRQIIEYWAEIHQAIVVLLLHLNTMWSSGLLFNRVPRL